jgi:nucleoside-diphosphate-sugar epimerase
MQRGAEASLEMSGTMRDAAPAGVSRLFGGLELAPGTDWRAALTGQEAVVHAAARVHIHGAAARDAVPFQRVNVDGTLNLARQAAAAGVRRFVFLSTIGVNGSETRGVPFTADDPAAPGTPYAVSKHRAEQGLHVIAAETGLEVVIIRPPLVIGRGAPGNVARLFGVMARGMPLPLGAIHNRRSFVGIENLAALVLLCLRSPAAANRTFLVSDAHDLSTTELLRRVAAALGRTARLVPVPAALVEAGLTLVGRGDLARQLCRSLQVDAEQTHHVLGWVPSVSLEQSLSQAAQSFLGHA